MDTKKDTIQTKPVLTSYEELTSGFRTSIVETSSGKVFEIQNTDPGGLFLASGAPLLRKFTQAGVNVEDPQAIRDHLDNLEVVDQIEVFASPDFQDVMKDAICLSVSSVNFVNKSKRECDVSLQEVSVSYLTIPELNQLFIAIMEISNTENEAMDFYNFREENDGVQEVQSNGDTSIQSGSEVRPETVGNPVPTQEESNVDVGDRQSGI